LVLFSQPTTKVVAMRLALSVAAVLAALVCTPVAGAWSWPADGAVLQPFVFDPAHPYASGEHRGLDIAGAAGSSVHAPRAGVVAFAGSVPGSGTSLTIATTDGYSVTLTHLGALAVTKGATVSEGDVVATLGAGGGEQSQPYLHLGVRHTAEAQGYVDPALLLPARAAPRPPAPAAVAAVPAPVPAPVEPPEPAAVPAPAQFVEPEAAPAAAPVAVGSDEPDAEPGLVVRPARAAKAVPRAPRPHVDEPRPAAGGAAPVVVVASPAARPAAGPVPGASAPHIVPRPFVPQRDPLLAELPAPRVVTAPIVRPRSRDLPLTAFAVFATLLAGAVVGACVAPGRRKAVRMMDGHVLAAAQNPGGAGLAVCGGVPAPWPRGGLRAVRRVRALSPLERERRPRGERHRRARHARDGGG
jgi:hypothetical protein